MKSLISSSKLAIVITLAGLSYLVEASDEATIFRRCYNISADTHCFDAQYDTSNNRWLTASFDTARSRCLYLSSTLLIIKDEEINDIVRQYFNDSSNPIRHQLVWMDAYQINDFNNNYTWHWIDSSIPTVNASDVTFTYDYKYSVAVLEFRNNSFYLTAKGPNQEFNYICEYPAESHDCTTSSASNVRKLNDRCYVATNVNVSWYEARNKCLKDGGDLASFVNVNSINFNSWLRSDQKNQYFIGLRFTWYIWKDTEDSVEYSNWNVKGYGENTPYLAASNDDPNFSWFPKENTAPNVSVVCHTVTSIIPTTTSTTTTTTTSVSTSTRTFQNSSESRTSYSLAIGVGVGVGVGVPVLVAIIVLVVCIVVRKRRDKTPSSTQSNNHRQKETSVDRTFAAMPENEGDEVGDSAYGTVVPSTIARQADAGGANPTSGNAEYAPLQFL